MDAPTEFSANDLAELLLGPDEDQLGGSESFQWAPCRYAFVDDDGEQHPAPINDALRLVVRMERTPQTQHDAAGTRYRWHKNCVLPRIRVCVQGHQEFKSTEVAAVRLSAVTIDALTNTARSVGLEGVCVRPLVRGECTFASLSFTATTYTLPGKPQLHLMASLLLRQETSAADGAPQAADGGAAADSAEVACCSISPGLTVDARKRQNANKAPAAPGGNGQALEPTGGDVHGGSGGSGSSGGAESQPAALPFAPDLLSARLQKVGRESERPVEIDNSIEGLRAYLSALNIRVRASPVPPAPVLWACPVAPVLWSCPVALSCAHLVTSSPRRSSSPVYACRSAAASHGERIPPYPPTPVPPPSRSTSASTRSSW